MIEIAAKLIGGPVYLPGDNIGCCITFVNKSPILPNNPSRSRYLSFNCCYSITIETSWDELFVFTQFSVFSFEILAWSSAQIHCSCVTNDKLVTLEKNSQGGDVSINSGNGQKPIYLICLNLYYVDNYFLCRNFIRPP